MWIEVMGEAGGPVSINMRRVQRFYPQHDHSTVVVDNVGDRVIIHESYESVLKKLKEKEDTLV